MRIICNTVQDFFDNIEGCELFDSTCWINKTSNPMDDNSRDAVKFMILLQAHAIKLFPTGAECLVELGIDCGYDYRDAGNDLTGSETADAYEEEILVFCKDRAFQVLPGILSE